MRLIRFSFGDAAPVFGIIVGDRALSLPMLQSRSGLSLPDLGTSSAYLAGLPHSEGAARALCAWGETHLAELLPDERPRLADVQLHEPVEVAALFDFGLTPRHLANSAATIMKYEQAYPDQLAMLQAFARWLAAPGERLAGRPEALSYYKCNMNTVVGDDVTIPWPAYTSRLDIEPELAVVYGNARQPLAGYCIFNDVSARDVQATEFVGGFCLTKDMANGNQLGPCLVTPDEIGDAYALAVTVVVDGRPRFQGTTAEISHRAQDAFAWLEFIAPLKSGTVIGMGTIPDCTGCDHDDFIDPGAEIAITFERIGTLRCRFAEPTSRLLPSRWPLRPALRNYHA